MVEVHTELIRCYHLDFRHHDIIVVATKNVTKLELNGFKEDA